MGVLDTFFLVFEGDTSKLEQGAKKSDSVVDKLKKDLEATDATAAKVGGSLAGMVAQIGGALTAALSLGAMAAGVKNASDYAFEIGRLSDALGLNIGELSAWSDAVKISGGDAAAFQGTVQGLSEKMTNISFGGDTESLMFFNRLGVEVRDAGGQMKSALDVLPELAESFEHMDKMASLGIGKKLGLDEGTILLLQKGRGAVDDLNKKQREAGGVTKEQAEIAKQLRESMNQLSLQFRGLFLAVGESILPAFRWAVDAFGNVVEFFKKHSDFITGVMIALGVAVATFLVPPLWSAAAAAIAAFGPFILIGVAVAALIAVFALLYDEIVNFIAGNDTMIGEISKKWPIVGEVVKGLIKTFAALWDMLKAVGSLLVGLFDSPQKAWDAFVKSIFESMGKLKEVFPFLSSLVGKAADLLGFGDALNGIEAARVNVSGAAAFPLNQTTSAAISNSNVQGGSRAVSVGKVVVNTSATDASGISKSIGNTLQEQLQTVVAGFDDGVAG